MPPSNEFENDGDEDIVIQLIGGRRLVVTPGARVVLRLVRLADREFAFCDCVDGCEWCREPSSCN